MERRRLADTQWASRPLLSPTVLGFLSGAAVFVVVSALIATAAGPDVLERWRYVFWLLGVSLIGGSTVAIRAILKGPVIGRLECEDSGLRVGAVLFPYGDIETIRYSSVDAAIPFASGGVGTTRDTYVDLRAGGRSVRLVAYDTLVEDLAAALSRIERENARCLVAPYLRRALRAR
jgi:hypothetical protein